MTQSSQILSEKELTSLVKGAGKIVGIGPEDSTALIFSVADTCVLDLSQIMPKHYACLVITGTGKIRMKVEDG